MDDRELITGVIAERLGFISARELLQLLQRCHADSQLSVCDFLVTRQLVTRRWIELVAQLIEVQPPTQYATSLEPATVSPDSPGSTIPPPTGPDTLPEPLPASTEAPEARGAVTPPLQTPRASEPETFTEGAVPERPPQGPPGQVADWATELGASPTLRREIETLPEDDFKAALQEQLRDWRPTRGSDDSSADGPPARALGRKLRFRVLKKHAVGGLGQVSVARDLDLNREVALKEIKAQYAGTPVARLRFLFEAEVTGRLEHPGVVPVYALGEHEDGRPYYVMRFIRGESLKQAVQDLHDQPGGCNFRTREFRNLLMRFVNVCNTIQYAHSRGVVHRDLKPANIMLGPYGETLVVDWGLAKFLGSGTEQDVDEPSLAFDGDSSGGQTQHGRALGTPQYMPPEQARGELQLVGPHSDIYSLGATLYYLLCRQSPIGDVSQLSLDDTLNRVKTGQLRPPRHVRGDIPRPLAAICMRAMAFAPEDRYRSAEALGREVEKFLADDPIEALPEGPWRRMARWFRKHRALAATAIAALLVIAVGALLFGGVTNHLRRRIALEQEFDQRLWQEERALARDDKAILTPASVDQLVQTLRAIEANRGAEDSTRRGQLLNVWVDAIRAQVNQRMSNELQERIEREFERFRNQFPWEDQPEYRSQLARLEKEWEGRLASWHPLPVELPQDAFTELTNGIWQRKQAPNQPPELLLGECLPGNHDFTVTFGAGWESATALGVVLDSPKTAGDEATSPRGYVFTVADETFNPEFPIDDTLPTLGESNRQQRVCLFICRDDTTIVKRPITLNSGVLPISARRERGNELTVAYGNQVRVSFVDLLPLPPHEVGRFGVICPKLQTIVDMRLLRQGPATQPESQPLIEQADQFYATGRYQEALRAYQRIVASHQGKRGPATEALFKSALCKLAAEDLNGYEDDLQRIRREHEPVDVSPDNLSRQWYLLAMIHLLTAEYEKRDEFTLESNELLETLESHFALETISRYIPEVDRRQFIDRLAKPGQRFRVAFDTQGDAAALLRAADLFSGDKHQRMIIRWRLADALRGSEQLSDAEGRQQALGLIKKMLEELPIKPTDPQQLTERVVMVSDYVWMLIQEDQLDTATAAIEQMLSPYQNAVTARLPSSYWPLLLDRARILFAKGEREDAVRDLEEFCDAVDPRTPLNGVSYAHFSEASAMLGWLYQQRGDAEEAQRVWLNARRRRWHGGFADPRRMGTLRGVEMILESQSAEALLASWTDGYRDGEWQNAIDVALTGSGITNQLLESLIKRKIRPEWKKKITETVFRSPSGRSVGAANVFRSHSYRSSVDLGAAMVLYSAVLNVSFDGEESLRKYPELDRILADQCKAIVQRFHDSAISVGDMKTILSLWTGAWSAGDFNNLESKLDDKVLSTGLALVIGNMLIKHYDQPTIGKDILQTYVLQRAGELELPYVYKAIADEAIAAIEARPEGT